MVSPNALDKETRTRIASLLYKLAIRVMKVSKRPLDSSRAMLALDHAQGHRVKKLIQFLTPDKGTASSVGPSIQKVLATRTVAPGQGDGIRVDLVFGPLKLLESKGDLGVITRKTIINPGKSPDGLVPIEKLQESLTSVFGGVLPQVKLITADVRDLADRPFRIEHSYDHESGTKAWKVVHNGGPKDGQVTFYENPHIVGQIEKGQTELDPYQRAVFRSAEDASVVLNQLTRGTSLGSRNFPKFREYTVYFKYSSVYLKSGDSSTLYNSFDRLLSEADAESEEKSKLSYQEKKELIERSVAWIREKEVSPSALMSTLQAKDPELAKKYKEVLPDVLDRLSELESAEKSSTKEVA